MVLKRRPVLRAQQQCSWEGTLPASALASRWTPGNSTCYFRSMLSSCRRRALPPPHPCSLTLRPADAISPPLRPSLSYPEPHKASGSTSLQCSTPDPPSWPRAWAHVSSPDGKQYIHPHVSRHAAAACRAPSHQQPGLAARAASSEPPSPSLLLPPRSQA